MRIRTVKPEFWSSEDIAVLDRDTRLLFIGLWSYVDDNGVGRDNEKLIVADIFPLEDDPREILATVSRGLQALSSGGQITRYLVGSKPFLFVNNWAAHQKIDKPNKARYPLPTCDDVVLRDSLATVSRQSREIPSPGAVEQRNRGTEEQNEKTCPAKPDESPTADPWLFSEFWNHYPRKVRKDPARKAWNRAVKRANPDDIVAAADRMAQDPNLPDEQFIPHPATWLNASGWDDPPFPSRIESRPAKASTTDQRVQGALALRDELARELAGDPKEIER